jgi:hypothetical protein
VLHFECAAHRVDDVWNSMTLPSPVRLTMRPWCTEIVGSIRSLRSARSRAKVRSSSARAGEPAVSDDVGDQDRSDLPRFRHGVASGYCDSITNDSSALLRGASRGTSTAVTFAFSRHLLSFLALAERCRGGTQLQKNEPKRLKSLRRAQN